MIDSSLLIHDCFTISLSTENTSTALFHLSISYYLSHFVISIFQPLLPLQSQTVSSSSIVNPFAEILLHLFHSRFLQSTLQTSFPNSLPNEEHRHPTSRARDPRAGALQEEEKNTSSTSTGRRYMAGKTERDRQRSTGRLPLVTACPLTTYIPTLTPTPGSASAPPRVSHSFLQPTTSAQESRDPSSCNISRSTHRRSQSLTSRQPTPGPQSARPSLPQRQSRIPNRP